MISFQLALFVRVIKISTTVDTKIMNEISNIHIESVVVL